MKYRASYGARYERHAPHPLMPPSLPLMGTVPFTKESFAELDAWLAENGWPAQRMDAAMLEGYLVALLVWPVEISAGAWLPTVWGIRGWKVAAKISTPEAYNRFIVLVVGFLQDLERRLTECPRQRPLVLERTTPILSARYFAGSAWATGFMVALHENFAGLGSRSVSARSAVETIAGYASLRSETSSSMASVCTALYAAVCKLMEDRPLSGALGPLPMNLLGTSMISTKRRSLVKHPTVPIP